MTMSLMSIFDISGSAMSAQSVRLNTTASNMANANSAAGDPTQVYRSRQPVFATIRADLLSQTNQDAFAFGNGDSVGRGVRVLDIVESEAPFQQRYEPDHPLADEQGYVYYPNVNIVDEMTNMISSSRSYQMNVDVMSAARTMMQRVLSLGQ